MLVFLRFVVLFLTGGLMYGGIETLFRGYTHWTMVLAGGLCFSMLYLINKKFDCPLWKKCVMGGAVITTVEFLTGCLVNLALGWHVWDYSHHMLNLEGQICMLFSLFWTLLSLPAMWLSSFIQNKVFPLSGKKQKSGE